LSNRTIYLSEGNRQAKTYLGARAAKLEGYYFEKMSGKPVDINQGTDGAFPPRFTWVR